MIPDRKIALFKNSKLLSLDIESYDPDLLTLGAGTHRGKGHICGVALATRKGDEIVSHYLSLAHPDTSEATVTYNKNILKSILSRNTAKLGANIVYDIEWLNKEGFDVGGDFNDVQYAEPLLNEYRRSYSLNNIAKSYHLRTKKTSVLEDYHKTMGWSGKPIENIWRMPYSVASQYALIDAELPLEIFNIQQRNLETQNLWNLYRMEADLIPIMLEMRRNGVRLDMKLLRKASMQAAEVHYNLKTEIRKYFGGKFNIRSSAQLAKLFDEEGIPFPRNPPTTLMKEKGLIEGSPNLNKRVLHDLAVHFPICEKILQYRHYDTLINMFLNNYATTNVEGKLYGSFHPLRNDNYGTVSGRFSSSKPNLQQVSAKDSSVEDESLDALKGQVVRRLFIPDEGYDKWAKLDYSQVEYRIMAHYATGEGSEELRESYCNNKEMDYHQRIMDATGFVRRIAKNVNFGGMYGIGKKTAAELFGWTQDDSENFLNGYHKSSPYIKTTRNEVSNAAARRGYIYTLLNRKARVHSSRKLHSMFNRLIQGSAADIMKKAMVDAHNKGLFNTLKLHITVHDELDVSYKDNPEGNEALEELKHTMEETVKLDVPILVDCHTGNNWAEAD